MKKIIVRPLEIFLMVSLGITILFFVANVLTKGELFEKCVMSSSFMFSDYFYHLAGSSSGLDMYSYGERFCFPPFAYLIYFLLWSLNPYKDNESIMNWQNYRNADNALLVFVVYNILLVILLIYCIGQYWKDRGVKYDLLLPVALILSYPFMCTALQRGNSVILAAILLALAWEWMDDKNRTKQELALVCIAVAAGLKIYPALIGVVFFKRKEWKKVIRLIIYGVVLIFVPFLFFGGYEGMQNLFKNLIQLAVVIDQERTNTVCGMAKWLGLKINMNELRADAFASAVNGLFFLTSMVSFFLSKKRWQEALFLSGILVSFLPSNHEYTLVYYLPVLFLFLKENDYDLRENRRTTKVWLVSHAVIFGMIFSVNFFMLYYRYGFLSGIFTVTYLLIGVNMLEVLGNLLKHKK